MTLDLAPRIDFFGKMLTVGQHDFTLWQLAHRDHHLKIDQALNKGVDVIGNMVKDLVAGGWDVRTLPIDASCGDFLPKIRITIHLDENRCITKSRPKS